MRQYPSLVKYPIALLLVIILFSSCDKPEDRHVVLKPGLTVTDTVFTQIVLKPELTLIDKVFTHENSDNEDKKMGFSIFSLPEYIPTNWISPVKYSNGEVHYRLSVLTKPDSRVIYYQMGFQWEGGCSGRFKEKFPSKELLMITEPGIYEASQTMDTFWEPDCQLSDPIHWGIPLPRLLVVVWDENFHQIDDRWGYGDNIDNIDGYYPMKVHYQAVIVPQGETFRGWEYYSITEPEE